MLITFQIKKNCERIVLILILILILMYMLRFNFILGVNFVWLCFWVW